MRLKKGNNLFSGTQLVSGSPGIQTQIQVVHAMGKNEIVKEISKMSLFLFLRVFRIFQRLGDFIHFINSFSVFFPNENICPLWKVDPAWIWPVTQQ